MSRSGRQGSRRRHQNERREPAKQRAAMEKAPTLERDGGANGTSQDEQDAYPAAGGRSRGCLRGHASIARRPVAAELRHGHQRRRQPVVECSPSGDGRGVRGGPQADLRDVRAGSVNDDLDSGCVRGPAGPARIGEILRRVIPTFELADEVEAIRKAPDWRARQAAIRAYYDAHRRIHGDDAPIDPYESDLTDTWTPIETQLWQDIRSTSRLPMVSQYPVGPYFLDFADPAKKIGLEADGKDFHDKIRDAWRDHRLWTEFGWKIYRVTGSECVRDATSPAEFARKYRERSDWRPSPEQIRMHAENYYMTTSTGVVDAIAHWEYGRWMYS